MKIIIIAAKSSNDVIGNNNDLVWHLPADLAFFKSKTKGHLVIMGRKTFESIGSKPLPGRPTIIVTRNKNFQAKDCQIAPSIPEALTLAEKSGREEVFILGGAEIYKKIINHADQMFITEVNAIMVGDTFFPEIDTTYWKEVNRESHVADEKNQFDFSFVEYLPIKTLTE